MNRCGDCKYFGEKPWNPLLESKASEISRPGDQHYDFHVCNLINDEISGRPAHVEDASGYYAALKVKEDFGCVLWEAK